MTNEKLRNILETRAPHEPEFHQAVLEVMPDAIPVIEDTPAFRRANIFERLLEPDRVISFQVPWMNDAGEIEVHRGWRVQYCGAVGPYKGGLRFHPSVNASILKFLGFEQTFKNALTGLPMGGGKGGANFDPKGRSKSDVMRFCNAFMTELHHHIGPDRDVPAGDVNVGAEEIGYLFGAYRRITHEFEGALTGKGLSFGGSAVRTEATGFGLIYFLFEMLEAEGLSLKDQTVAVSGAGNVASHAAEKAVAMGASVIALSDSSGVVVDRDGFTQTKIDWVREHKTHRNGSLEPYADEFDAEWREGETPWGLEGVTVALPCATQNELDEEDARTLIDNGAKAVAEGANMPCTAKAKCAFRESDVLFAPGKAANAGGVAVSGLEITQNRMSKSRSAEEIDADLKEIMRAIHAQCRKAGEGDDGVSYARGANVAGFMKVANALCAQGAE